MTELQDWARSLSYAERFKALSHSPDGDAQIADPVESPMWYVDFPYSLFDPREGESRAERRQRLVELASSVISAWAESDAPER